MRWKKVNLSWYDFCNEGLNKVGTFVETSGNLKYLIGDINRWGGVCDDCMAFDKNTKILRYKYEGDLLR